MTTLKNSPLERGGAQRRGVLPGNPCDPSAFLLTHFDRLAEAPGGIAKLRALVLQLAVEGKLGTQNANDEHAVALIKETDAERLRLTREGRINGTLSVARIPSAGIASDLPRGWAPARLQDLVLEIQTGPFGSSLHKSDYQIGGIPVINPASMKEGKIEPIDEMAIGPATLKRLEVFKLKAGDIIMARRGEMGRCAIVTKREEGWLCGTGSLVLRMPQSLYAPYLAMLIGGPKARQYLGHASVGTTMQNLNQSILAKLEIGLPPLAEQRRIVAKVEELMGLCDALEAAQQERETVRTRLRTSALHQLASPDLDSKSVSFVWQNLPLLTATPEDFPSLRQSVVQLAIQGKLTESGLGAPAIDKPARIFDDAPFEVPTGWRWVKLKDVTKRVHYGFTASSDAARRDVRLLRITDIQDSKVEWDTVPGCEIESDQVAKYELKPRDILIARTGGTIGKTFLVEEAPVCAVFASYLIRVIPDDGVSEYYLKRFFESPLYWEQLYEESKGTGQPNVNGVSLSNLNLPLPPLAEQRRIVAKVDELMAVLDALEATLTTARTTAASLLAATIARLTVSDEEDEAALLVAEAPAPYGK